MVTGAYDILLIQILIVTIWPDHFSGSYLFGRWRSGAWSAPVQTISGIGLL
jgi:hypothetical protein